MASNLTEKGGNQRTDFAKPVALLGNYAVLFGLEALGQQSVAVDHGVQQVGGFQLAAIGKIHVE